MSGEVTFVYAADLHLGAAARGCLDVPPEWAARLQRSIGEAYDRVIDAAVAHGVDFVVLSGDVFDASLPSYGEFVHFFEGLERLDAAGIATRLVTEGRSPYASWARDVDRVPASVRQVGAAELESELGAGLAMFAHESRADFPGCAQAYDARETGDRGCYLARVRRDGGLSVEFVPTASVVFERLSVDVSACKTLADVSHLVQAELFRVSGGAHCDEMVAQVELVGATELHGFLVRGNVITDLRKRVNEAFPSFFCDSLKSRTRPAGAHADSLFQGLVADMADEQRAREDVAINFVQAEFVKRGVAVPGSLSRRVAEFSDESEALVLDLLREEADDGGGAE